MSDGAPSLRARVHSFLDPSDGMARGEREFNIFLAVLIAATILTTLFSTMPQGRPWAGWLQAFDVAAGTIFLGEYLLRIWVVPERLGRPAHTSDYLAYMLRPLTIIDLVVVLSLLTPATWALSALRGLRLLKLLSLFRLGRYSDSLQVVGRVLASRLGLLVTSVTIVLAMTFIAATLIWQVEHPAGTEGFESIPAALWWATVTLTTTGYGDVYPVTTVGKALASAIMVFSLGMVALPSGIIAGGFLDALQSPEKYAPPSGQWRVRYSFADGHHTRDCGTEGAARAAVDAWAAAREHRTCLMQPEGDGVIDLAAAHRAEALPPGVRSG